MKRIHFAIVLLTFIGLVFFGCTDKVQSPTAASDNTLQSLSKTEGPGAWVLSSADALFGSEYIPVFYDPNSHLLLILGYNDIGTFLESDSGIDTVNFTEILLPQNSTQRRELFRATNDTLNAMIFYFENDPDFEDLLSAAPIATGTVNFALTDNDYLPVHKNRNSWGITANGNLTGGKSGNIYKLTFVFRDVWYQDDPTDGTVKLKIQLTPSYTPPL